MFRALERVQCAKDDMLQVRILSPDDNEISLRVNAVDKTLSDLQLVLCQRARL